MSVEKIRNMSFKGIFIVFSIIEASFLTNVPNCFCPSIRLQICFQTGDSPQPMNEEIGEDEFESKETRLVRDSE